MYYPTTHAARTPDKPAVIMAESGRTLTYRELDENSKKLSQLWWRSGLRAGDHVAVLLNNCPEIVEIYWAAMRSGLYFTPVNAYLTAAEVAFVVDNSDARSFIAMAGSAATATEIIELTPKVELRLAVGAAIPGYLDYVESIADLPAEALECEPLGMAMVYSSGSTGRPKGVKRALSGRTVAEGHENFINWMSNLYGADSESIYLSPAPLYHAAPLSFSSTMTALGGTVVLMERFDAASCLHIIAEYGVTHAQFVPTMLLRLLRLPEEVRRTADLHTMRVAIHGAGPCAVPVKEAIISWWGPIVYEYYAGSEDNGTTFITSPEWLTHRGSVGRAIEGCSVHICDEAGTELPTGQDGLVYFESHTGRADFVYYGEPDKTGATRHPLHDNWTSLGDIGHLDDGGYLYLTDRASFMIISGGVNISPQEIEDALSGHPKVADVAVIGVPNAEFGEEVKAVVQPADGDTENVDLAPELLGYLRARLAPHKLPRSIDLVPQLPRAPTGKLYKRALRDEYWAAHRSRIV